MQRPVPLKTGMAAPSASGWCLRRGSVEEDRNSLAVPTLFSQFLGIWLGVRLSNTGMGLATMPSWFHNAMLIAVEQVCLIIEICLKSGQNGNKALPRASDFLPQILG